MSKMTLKCVIGSVHLFISSSFFIHTDLLFGICAFPFSPFSGEFFVQISFTYFFLPLSVNYSPTLRFLFFFFLPSDMNHVTFLFLLPSLLPFLYQHFPFLPFFLSPPYSFLSTQCPSYLPLSLPSPGISFLTLPPSSPLTTVQNIFPHLFPPSPLPLHLLPFTLLLPPSSLSPLSLPPSSSFLPPYVFLTTRCLFSSQVS